MGFGFFGMFSPTALPHMVAPWFSAVSTGIVRIRLRKPVVTRTAISGLISDYDASSIRSLIAPKGRPSGTCHAEAQVNGEDHDGRLPMFEPDAHGTLAVGRAEAG